MAEAKKAYVTGEKERAVELALQAAEKPGPHVIDAWRFVGSAACSIHNASTASRAYAHLGSAEHKQLLIDRLWASQKIDRYELVQFLHDENAEVRNKALWRMRELCRDRFNVLQDNVELFSTEIDQMPKNDWSYELRAYLADPAGPEPEDDPWD